MELMQRLLYTLIGAASFFYAFVKVRLSHWKKRGILHEKPKFFWGNLKGVGSKKQLQQVLNELYEKYKSKAPFIGFYAFLKPMLLILDLDLVQQILNSDAAYFMERGLYQNVKDAPLTYNLLQLDADKWHELQPKLKPCYAADKMQLLLPTLERVARTFTHSLQQLHLKQDIFNINELVDSYNLDVISLVAFGFQSDTLRSSTATEFQQMSRRHWLNCSYLKAYLAMEFPNIARLFQYKLYDQAVSDYFMKIVQDKLKERERNRNSYTSCDFLKIFSATKQQLKLDQRLTSAQMAAHGFSYILIGLEACTTTMAMCLYELAAHPELQQKARAQINKVLAVNNDELNVECLKELHYLKQVLYETLRKYPPYPVLLRKVTQDYEVPNSTFMLRRDNHLIIPVAAIHNDPNLYPEPQKFDPERFEPTAKAERHAMSWLPFGSGARGCLAQEFAVKQMLMGLLTLLRDYEFSPCADTIMPPKYDNKWVFQLKTSHDIKLKLKCLR